MSAALSIRNRSGQSKIQKPKTKINARIAFLVFTFTLLFSLPSRAHVGSPDVFYDGMVGPYPARITIRMPNVVPGRAEISVRVQSTQPVEVSFLPLYSLTAITNAPPPDIGRLVTGETNLYAGELWLMSFGAYSVEIRIKGKDGEGSTQIPVTSVAIRQLPLPFFLGKVLLVLVAVLVIGGIGIAAAAGREAALPTGTLPEKRQRRNGYLAATAATLIFVAALAGGKFWWSVEEKSFRSHLLAGAWPDLTTDVRVSGNQRILRLEVGKTFFEQNNRLSLIPDHGKLMHLFLIRENSRDAFAHLHPIRKEGYVFEVAIPSLPEGRYAIFCDLTFEGGVSSTATNSILLPPAPAASDTAAKAIESDPDDSWATFVDTIPALPKSSPAYRLPDGTQVTWKSQKPLRTKQDASLKFEVTDSAGEPVSLEPYMGMLCHAAVLRSDGSIFAHLHPAGNFSMAAQSFFETKLANETKTESGDRAAIGSQDHMMMHHHHPASASSSVYLPYEFPEPGNYRIWVQFKINGRIVTAVFDAAVNS
jgi:hypothetical protein